ncbi:Ig-like domain repeat protein [Methanobrevibacter woesei]|uniref:Ig-like domain repeat protein n=1 Tax=Methanobrevibacter woesei TaxID=190976 RepID=UPI0023F4E95D|nr:Ig-like domain repeat protein [Methanobrevibacter woesei]
MIMGINAVSAENLDDVEDISGEVSFTVETISADDSVYMTNDKVISTSGEVTLANDNTVYVNGSYSGDIEDGSQVNPYKTISSAVENAADGSKIYIANGIYDDRGMDIEKSLSIVGESQDVIISPSTSGYVFFGSGESNLLFSNITFKDVTAGNYAVVRGGGSGNITIEDCNFYNCSAKYGAMQLFTTSTATVNNCNIVDTKISTTAGAAVYLSGSGEYTLSNSLIKNSTYSGSSGYMYGVIYNYNTNGILNIFNTTISGSKGTANSVIYNRGDIYIEDSIIEDNLVYKNAYGYQGESIFYNRGNLYIDSSIISDNSGSDFIFYQGMRDCEVKNSAILNNEFLESFYDTTINVDYNWWGTNDKPYDFVNNWIVMDYTIDSADVAVGEDVSIDVTFDKYTDGTTEYDLTDAIADGIKVEFAANNGVIDEYAYTENGKANAVYSASVAGSDVITVTSGDLTLSIPINVAAQTSAIYVSSSKGDDNNDGSESSPVKTIAKAIELAEAGETPTEIIIEEGTYQENSFELSNDISFIGQGEVYIDGNNEDVTLFTIRGGNVLFDNINFVNVDSGDYGAVITVAAEDFSRDTVYANVTVNNCNFVNLSARSGAGIYVEYGAGLLNVSNSNFTNITTTSRGGAVMVDMGYNLFDTVIDNCIFDSNHANNAGALYLRGNTAVITNSLFNNNSATYYPGAIWIYNTTTTIDNCTIVNSSAAKQSAAIQVEAGPSDEGKTVTITNSIIADNNATEQAPAIYVYKGTVDISYSYIVNDMGLETYYYSSSYSGVTQGVAIANNNWWGTNDPTTMINGNNITMDSWVIMDIDVELPDSLNVGDSIEISVNFNCINTTEGTIEELTGGSIPGEFTVDLEAIGGTLSDSQIITNDKIGSVTYTVTDADGPNFVTFTVDNEVMELNLVKIRYNGTIYVSADGDDNNDGSKDSPVKTISKAIELAESGSHEIIVDEGTYVENNLQVSSDLIIAGEGNVIIDGNNTNSIFASMSNVNLTLNNIALTGGNKNYGAVLRASNSNIYLNNVDIYSNTVTSGFSTTLSALYISGGKLVINNTQFHDNKGNGFIYASGDVIIENSTFNNNMMDSTGNGYSFIYSENANVVISKSNFTNNIMRQGIIQASNGNVTISESNFVSNEATSSGGGVIYINRDSVSLNIDKSVFKSNKAYRNGGAIYTSASTVITNSIFVDNVAGSTYDGDAIYTDADEFSVSYSAFIGDSSNYLIFTEGEDTSSPTAQYNWWGTNDNPSNKVGAGSYYSYDDFGYVDSPAIDTSNWIIMNVEVPEEVFESTPINVVVDFNHYLDSATNEIKELPVVFYPSVSVDFESENGTFSYDNLTTKDGVATNTYIPIAGNNTLNIISGNENIEISFMVNESTIPGYIVTNDTFFNFFDKDGNLLDSVEEGSMLTFVGEFSGLPGIFAITIDRELAIVGNNAVLKDIFVQLIGSNINMTNFNIVVSAESALDNGIVVEGENIRIENNHVNVTTDEYGGYAILVVGTVNLDLNNNTVYFYGDGDQWTYTRGIDISESSDIKITNNDFEFVIPSIEVGYDANYNADIKSLGMIISDSDNFAIVNNTIKTSFNGKMYGSFDTSYGVYITTTPNGIIENNTIYSEGNAYIYGVSIIGMMDYDIFDYVYCSNVTVQNNNITSIADGYGAWGIQAQVGDGAFINNNVVVDADDAVYGIYTEGFFGDTSFDMINNTISASANSVWAISSAGQNENIIGNNITATGNYTLGIYSGPFGTDIVAVIENNTINSLGSGSGISTGSMPNPLVTGIYVLRQGATIVNNNITTTGEFTIVGEDDATITVTDNYLIADTAKGDQSVNASESSTVQDNLPRYNGIIYVSVDGDDLNEGSIDLPVKTIAKAIELALSNGGSGHIIIGPGVFNESELESSDDLIIEGAGSGETIIDAKGQGVVIKNLFASLTLKGLSLINGYNTIESGGAITSMGDLSLEDVIISDSYALFNGGAIYAVGNVYISNSVIANNTGDVGGAIYLDYFSSTGTSSLVIENSEFISNTAETGKFGGGAIYMQTVDGEKYIVNTTFASNKANAGGAIFMQQSSGDFTISGSTFVDNEIDSTSDNYGGGAICVIGQTYAKEGNVIITGSKFINNSAVTSAGAIYVRNVDVSISKSFIINNTDADGCAIYNYITSYYPNGGTVTVEDNWWGNTADNTEFDSNLINEDVDTPDSWLILNMTVDKEYVSVGDTVEVTIDLTHNQEGVLIDGEGLPFDTVNVVLGENSYVVDLVNGVAKVNVTIDNAEENNIVAELEGITIEQQVGIRVAPEFDVSVDDVEFGESATVVVTVSPDASGNVTIVIGDIVEVVEIVDGEAVLTVDGLVAGDYLIEVSYAGDDKYLAANASASFTVEVVRVAPEFDVSVDDVEFGESATVVVTVSPDASGNVTIVIGDIVEVVEIVDGEAVLTVDGLVAGDYLIEVSYAGDDKYLAANASASFTVNMTGVILDADDLVLYYHNGSSFVVKLTDTAGNPIANETVIFSINGNNYTRVTDEDGFAFIAINLNAGNYVIETYYDGRLGSAHINNTVTVLSTIAADNVVKYFRNGTQYYALILDGEGNPVSGVNASFNINGVFYNRVTDSDGIARLNINLNPGEYILTVENPVTGELSSNNITVLSTIISEDLIKYFHNESQYEVVVVDGEGNPVEGRNVSFNINGVIYYRVTDENGSVSLNINLNPGEYIITVTDEVTGLSMSNNITVLSTIIADDVVKYFRNGTQYHALLVDGEGNPIADRVLSFNINGVFYNRVTDSDGIATLNINLNPGKYILTAIDQYSGLMMSNEITVLPVLTGEDKNIDFGSGDTYDVALVDGNGNPVAGENVTININGVFYNRVTDSDGVARLNINLNPGEYVATASWGYAAISNKIVVS